MYLESEIKGQTDIALALIELKLPFHIQTKTGKQINVVDICHIKGIYIYIIFIVLNYFLKLLIKINFSLE